MKKIFTLTLCVLLLFSLLVACADGGEEPVASDTASASDSESGTVTAAPSESATDSESEEATETSRGPRPARPSSTDTTDVVTDSSDSTNTTTPPADTQPPLEGTEDDSYDGGGVKLPEVDLWS